MVRLLGEVAALPEGHQEKKQFLMKGLCSLVQADAWVWALSCQRNPGEEQIHFNMVYDGLEGEKYSSFLKAVNHPVMAKAIAPFFAQLAQKQSQITMRREDIDPQRISYQPEVNALWQAADIDAVMMVGHPLDAESLSTIGLYRKSGRPHFSERESQIAHIILQEVPWLHLSGWPEDKGATVPSLSPQQRIVLNLLLDGLPRKEIAANMDIAENTVSGYVKEVYRHFGVNSQAGLMNKFLKGSLKS
jgi:DNA-binding CsgD family transcriptional regulator